MGRRGEDHEPAKSFYYILSERVNVNAERGREHGQHEQTGGMTDMTVCHWLITYRFLRTSHANDEWYHDIDQRAMK